jgi:glutamyl endopeptidase
MSQEFAEVRALFAQERANANSRARGLSSPAVVVPISAKTEVVSPHTPVSNHKAMETASGPQFGSEGPPPSETGEVEVQTRHLESALESAGGDESMLLDAYWASFGNAGTRAVLRRDRQEESSILEVVIGTDDRTEVTSNRDYPWRCIASLLITATDGTQWIGTAWFVGPRILMTAGHCVYMTDHGGWAQQIEVIPGRRGDDRPYNSCVSSDLRSVNGWINDNDRNYDYGAIMLPADCRLGDTVGWFGYQVRNDDDLRSLTVNLSGYPGDKPVGTQWFHKNTLTGVDNLVVTYEIDTAGGQSGAPVWVKLQDGGRYGVGVHTNGDITGNSATRITQEVFDNITAWKAEVP